MVPVVAKILEGIETTPRSIRFFDDTFPNLFLNTGTSRQKSGWNDNGCFSVLFHGVDNMLNEQKINVHAIFLFLVGCSVPLQKALFIVLAGKGIPAVGKIYIKGGC